MFKGLSLKQIKSTWSWETNFKGRGPSKIPLSDGLCLPDTSVGVGFKVEDFVLLAVYLCLWSGGIVLAPSSAKLPWCLKYLKADGSEAWHGSKASVTPHWMQNLQLKTLS